MPVLHSLGLALPFDSQCKFVTSPFFSPTVLACIRLTFGVYLLTTLIVVLVKTMVTTHDASNYFAYFTELTGIGLCSYLWAAGTQTVFYVGSGHKRYPLQRWPRFLQFLHVLLHTTIVTLPILVTIVYWALLASSSTFSSPYNTWSAVSLHMLNTVFALSEILLTNTPPIAWLYLVFNIIILGGYLGVAYITHITEGFYTYSFLDPTTHQKTLPAYIVGIAVAEAVVFVIVHFVIVLRERYAIKTGKIANTTPAQERVASPLDEWQNIDRPKTPLAL